MKNVTITQALFTKAKPYLDGLVFWREVEQGVEIKFIPCYLEYIPDQLLTHFKTLL